MKWDIVPFPDFSKKKGQRRFVGIWLLRLPEIDSTNSLALREPQLLKTEGLTILADTQLKGRGQRGRHWYSGPKKHLYASSVIHEKKGPQIGPCITLLVGLAVYRVLYGLGTVGLSIKWPNDVLINGKKVCGILVESKEILTTSTLASVVGIGVNVEGSCTQFPDEIRHTSTTLEEQGVKVEPIRLLDEILDCLDEILIDALDLKKRSELLTEWEHASSSLGKDVVVDTGEKRTFGKILGISDTGTLLVKTTDGNIFQCVSGEVRYV